MESIVGYKNYKISIFDYIPEINAETKKLITYKEVYDTLFRFTCNDLLFINLFRVNQAKPNYANCYSAILYFPYTPQFIASKATNQFCQEMAKYLNLFDKFQYLHKQEVIRQKLMDLFYTAEDGESTHLILDCRSILRACNELASQFCSNYCCKHCCLANPLRRPCFLHD